MTLSLLQYVLGACSGSLVGLALGLFGGGGSILAVPLMVYIVGVPDPHVAIGTSALAVAANASANLISHARQGNVKWRCAATYSIAGVCGAYAGSSLGKMFDGQTSPDLDPVQEAFLLEIFEIFARETSKSPAELPDYFFWLFTETCG